MTNFTGIFSDLSFSNIEVDDISLTNPGICYTTTSGEKDCKILVLSEGITTLESLESLDSLESILPPDIDVRLISENGTICYVTIDEVMECTLSNEDLPDQNQFPTAPRNLSVDFFSETEAELTWARPSESRLSDEFASGYEIFRDGVLIERLPVVTSFFDNNTNPAANYEVRATRALIAGASSFTSFLDADGSDTEGPGMPVEPEPTPPTTPTAPTAPTTPVDDAGSLGLTGTVYSSTALELFYNQSRAGSSALRYNIFRDGELIRGNSPATSQFEAGLDVNTSYVYEVEALLDGNIISAENITLTTLDDGSGSEPVALSDVTVILSAAVYSSTAIELFWNRASISGVTYNIFRDGVLIRENSPAISQFEGVLPPDNTFTYEVVALLDGDAVASSTITINTINRHRFLFYSIGIIVESGCYSWCNLRHLSRW